MRHFLAAALTLCPLLSYTQQTPRDYPRGYFRDPLNIPMSLAANFGELRPNHYHMGLDIRTERRENLPVFAAADGYIARVVIEPAGFGQAIYIRHPNGYTTLYAHLNKFMPGLAAYVAEQQYKQQAWSVQLEIPKELFPVKKGEQIAYSGNTGGSQGPHLHFEIRNTAADVNLNPLLFGLPVPDDTPPVIQRLAVYNRNESVYEQTPRILPVHKQGSGASYGLTPGLVIVHAPKVSFAISAFDTQSGSTNPNGIFEAAIYDNDRGLISFQMDNISYNDTRNLNAHIDYKTRATGGPWLQHLSLLPGYTPPTIYHSMSLGSMASGAGQAGRPADGVIDLSDRTVHRIRIEVRDAYGNACQLNYQVQYQPGPADGAVSTGQQDSLSRECYPGMLDGFEAADCSFYTGENSVYDSVHIAYASVARAGAGISLPGGISAVHKIGEPWIPLQDPVLVRIRPERGHEAAQRERVVMVCFKGDKKDVRRPEWKGEWASAKFREFGYFQLVEDLQAPVILPVGPLQGANLSKASRIAINVKDNLGAIRNFRAELDPPADGRPGSWLCFTNDKGLAFIYKFDGHCPAGSHTLKITVEDEAGNRSTALYKFIR